MRIKVQMKVDSKPSAQRRRDQSGPSRRAHQSESRQLQFNRTRAGSLTNQKIETEVFHRWIKLFFEGRQQPMDFINEKYVAFLKIRKQRRDVSSLFNGGAGSRASLGSHFVRDDMRPGGFSPTRWAGQQNMIGRLSSLERCFDVNAP